MSEETLHPGDVVSVEFLGGRQGIVTPRKVLEVLVEGSILPMSVPRELLTLVRSKCDHIVPGSPRHVDNRWDLWWERILPHPRFSGMMIHCPTCGEVIS